MSNVNTISAVILNLFILAWFIHVTAKELQATVKDMENKKFVYWDYLHSREHLVIMIVLIFLGSMLFILTYDKVCLSYIFLLVVSRVFIVPHYKKERENGFKEEK